MKQKALKRIKREIEWIVSADREHTDVVTSYYNVRGMIELALELNLIDKTEYDSLISLSNNALGGK